MCGSDKKDDCCCGEKKVEKPSDCSPEQIEECHGSSGDHPCEETGCQK